MSQFTFISEVNIFLTGYYITSQSTADGECKSKNEQTLAPHNSGSEDAESILEVILEH